MTTIALQTPAQLVKVDANLGLVFGFAVVSTLDGEPFFDSQGDHIPEGALLKAAAAFMEEGRVSTDQHARASVDGREVPVKDGTVVFAFPLTAEIAKALDITTKQTGLLVAMKPSPGVLEKFQDGTYTGFSIGGAYGEVKAA